MSKHLLSLKEAAESVGKGKATIHRACKKGKVSYAVDQEGRFKIQPQEMARAYPDEFSVERLPVRMRDKPDLRKPSAAVCKETTQASWLRREIEFLNEKLELLTGERDQERLRMAEEIEHLRNRLEHADGQRSKLTNLLQDKQTKSGGNWFRMFTARNAAQ